MYNAYLITNKLTGQQYVGMSKHNYERRFKDHFIEAKQEASPESKRKGSKLHTDMVNLGIDNFYVELLEDNIPECPDELHQIIECKYINQYQTYYLDGKDGYNMTRGGNGTIGYIFTDEDKEKMSLLHKGKPLNISPEGREARRKRMLKENRPFKQEWREAIRAKRLGKYKGEENGFYGKHHTPEVLQAIKERNSGSPILQYNQDWEFIQEFFNLNDAGRWVVSQGISNARYDTCALRISEVCRSENKRCTAYGYHWKKKEGQSTNSSSEDELPNEAQSTV